MPARDPGSRPSRRTVLAALPALIASSRAAGLARGEPAPAPATAPPPPSPGPASAPALIRPPADADAVRWHADALLARAVRSPYGWGWAEGEPGVDLSRTRDPKARARPVDGLLTARAGLLLALAGEAVGHPPYKAAAVEAARGLAALQTRAGQFRGRGVMGMVMGVQDAAAAAAAGGPPDRGPTCAAVALLAHLLDVPGPPDQRLRGPFQRAGHWLASQQTRAGGWPSGYATDPGKGASLGLLRLDAPDFRDAALATLLVADLLDDRQLRTHVDRAADQLVALRLTAGRPIRRALWTSAYRPDGDADLRLPGLPLAVDTLATRHAAEVLLASYLAGFASRLDAPLADAREALAALPRTPDGRWHRRYHVADLQPMPDPEAAATRPVGVFDFAPPPPATNPSAAVAQHAPPRTAELVARLARVRAVGPKRLADELAAFVPLRKRMVLAVAGLADDALVVDAVRLGAPAAAGDDGELSGTLNRLWHAVAG